MWVCVCVCVCFLLAQLQHRAELGPAAGGRHAGSVELSVEPALCTTDTPPHPYTLAPSHRQAEGERRKEKDGRRKTEGERQKWTPECAARRGAGNGLEAEREPERELERGPEREAERKPERETERNTERETEKETERGACGSG